LEFWHLAHIYFSIAIPFSCARKQAYTQVKSDAFQIDALCALYIKAHRALFFSRAFLGCVYIDFCEGVFGAE